MLKYADGLRLFLATWLAGPVAAYAQTTTPAPSLPTREEVSQPDIKKEEDRGRVRVDSSSAVARGECPLRESDVRATITSVQFSGANGTTLPPEILALLSGIKPSGSDAPISVVCDLRDQADAALRAERYIAITTIPSQKIDDGILRLEVVTARIAEMRVRGDAGPYEKVLEQRIELLKKLDPLNAREIEEILLLASDIPGLDVQLVLNRGARTGEVIGELNVSYDRLSVVANVQNYGSKQLGRETGYVRAELRGLTGMSDLTYLGVATSRDFQEQRIAQLGHVMGIGDSGLTVGAHLTYAQSKPDLGTLSISTRSIIGKLEVAYPIVRTVRQTLSVSGGLEFVEQRSRILVNSGAIPFNLDRLATVYARASADTRNFSRSGTERFRAGAWVEVRQGLAMLGATTSDISASGQYARSRFGADATPLVLRAQASAIVNLGKIFSVSGTARGQWSNNALLNFDEFSIGNLTIGRGYDPGANSGDRALGSSVEAVARVIDRPKLGAEAFVFYDSVRLWNLAPSGTEKDRTLRSFGGGARFSLPGKLLLEVAYAKPLDRALSIDLAKPKGRVLVSLTAQVWPFFLSNSK